MPMLYFSPRAETLACRLKVRVNTVSEIEVVELQPVKVRNEPLSQVHSGHYTP